MGGEEHSKRWTQFAKALHNRVEHIHGVIVRTSAITEERKMLQDLKRGPLAKAGDSGKS